MYKERKQTWILQLSRIGLSSRGQNPAIITWRVRGDRDRELDLTIKV